jgi:hypothetical protein
MKKFPFNARSVQTLQTELYALKDDQLSKEVAAIVADFRTWMRSKFEFDPKQSNYLEKLSANFIHYASLRIGFAIVNRLPIYFNNVNFDEEDSGAEKIIRSSDKTYFSTDGIAMGSLSFDVSYKLSAIYNSI